jgi:hypothetical protein
MRGIDAYRVAPDARGGPGRYWPGPDCDYPSLVIAGMAAAAAGDAGLTAAGTSAADTESTGG